MQADESDREERLKPSKSSSLRIQKKIIDRKGGKGKKPAHCILKHLTADIRRCTRMETLYIKRKKPLPTDAHG